MSQKSLGGILRRFPHVLIAIVVLAAGAGPSVLAAEPSGGTLGGSHDEATWTGTFYAPNPATCATSADPLCDHFRLSIDGGSIRRVLIAISPEAGSEGDDYDLFVYDDQGALVASQADGDGNESVVIENTGSAFYEVRVQPFLITPGSTYRGVAVQTREQAADADEADCLEAVPSD